MTTLTITETQKTILFLLAKGYSVRKISQAIMDSDRNVRHYIEQLQDMLRPTD